MTLRRKMALHIAGTILGLLLVCAASLWGINSLRHNYDIAIRGYEELRELYDVASHVATARMLLSLSRPEEQLALEQIRTALGKIDLTWKTPTVAHSFIRAKLNSAAEALNLASTNHPATDPSILVQPLNALLVDISNLASAQRQKIERSQDAADHRRRLALSLMAGLSAIVIIGVVLLVSSEYRSVISPLKRLQHGVRTLAARRFSERLDPVGPAEFAALATDFNRMAEELDELYRSLEQKVAARSRELVRSERLASVGYLAAGVAHEINNPVGIIAGHAEFALQRFDAQPPPNHADLQQTLRVIADESFRCKQIVQKLLSLARPGDDTRARISLAEVASSVISTISGLAQYRSRQLTLDAPASADAFIHASEGEMKQVILNLVLNALDATDPQSGRVRIEISRRDDSVELAVVDNGKGMTADVLEHVFQPFFTAKRGAAQPGTGLGLSISHAIVEAHGGRISGHSDGPGTGSRFVITLPAADKGGTP